MIFSCSSGQGSVLTIIIAIIILSNFFTYNINNNCRGRRKIYCDQFLEIKRILDQALNRPRIIK